MTDQELVALVNRYQAEQRTHEVIWFYRAVEKIKPSIATTGTPKAILACPLNIDPFC